ncbi:MAG: (d)CMP kinase [Bacillus sp. (in: Bacteria)]|nr:(d)CMP kinase [Bacillus sp. (in: firmicutes)]MCM1427825.1 (d)CMP kinase [Eubacterium sp.]
MGFQIAIDGPAGAGKSTIAKKVASRLGFIYVDTGAMYRAMALFLMRAQIAPQDADAVAAKCGEADITIRYENKEQVVYLNGENVNGLIRTEEVGNMASQTSANQKVREKLVKLQQKLAADADVVMDGRDIGTCVLPNAEVKIFLTASSKVRAERRYKELTARGEDCDIDLIEKDIIARDHQDMTREISPLVAADDSVLIDSSYMTIDEVAAEIMKRAGRK